MNRASSVLEAFPVEERLTSEASVLKFRVTYDHIHGWFEHVERQARLHEAAARGLIDLPTKKRSRFVPANLPGRPLSELLREVRD
jgi:hypothetical protein